MEKIKLIITNLCILLCLNIYAQNNKEQQMEELVQKIYNNIHNYPQRPVFSVQVDKTGCRLSIEMKDYLDYKFTESNGESMNLPLNYFITKSGKQTAIIKVYPKEGEQYISKYAMVNLNFYRAPDKDSNMDAYLLIAKYSLPQGLEEKKLPYYEAQVEFNADVPFDYSKELENSMDLTKISNIEEKVVYEYKKIGKIILDNDFKLYEEARLKYLINFYDVSYSTLEEIKQAENEPITLFDERFENKELLPIEDYVIQYYAGGKIVALRNKQTMKSSLIIKGRGRKRDGTYRDMEIPSPLFLYMPKGNNELKVW